MKSMRKQRARQIVMGQMMSALPEGNSMISTQPHGPFFVPFKFAFAFAVAVAMPYLLYQLWAFVAPGSRPEKTCRNERNEQ